MSRGLLALAVLLTACGVRHSPPVQSVFRIELREGTLHLIPPALPGGVVAKPIAFSQIIASQYGYNPWEQYVDLSQGMRLAVQRMTGQTQTANSYYGIDSAGRRVRIRSLTPDSETLDRRVRYLRFFYQTKFVKSPGQPVRPALCLWSDSIELLGARTAEASQNPALSCIGPVQNCVVFPGKATVSPEIQISVNRQPRYVLLGSTLRDLLRTDRVADTVEIRLLRRYRNHLIPVTWEQKAHVMTLPFLVGDDVSW
jgi:hypothetical protein